MLLWFDYRCSKCEHREVGRAVHRGDMDSQKCGICAAPMYRLPAGTRTTFRFADEKLKK